jgi:hypothetical protein
LGKGVVIVASVLVGGLVARLALRAVYGGLLSGGTVAIWRHCWVVIFK